MDQLFKGFEKLVVAGRLRKKNRFFFKYQKWTLAQRKLKERLLILTEGEGTEPLMLRENMDIPHLFSSIFSRPSPHVILWQDHTRNEQGPKF